MLDQVKEKIMYAWTDQIRYLGKTITSKVECSWYTEENDWKIVKIIFARVGK